jgi:LmbE family N-acetylglucosaminyl deacetylase
MKVLAIGAHPDDIEIGCGGALAVHAQNGDRVHMVTMTAGEKGGEGSAHWLALTRLAEAKKSATILGATFESLEFPDTELAQHPEAMEALEKLVKEFKPDRVYIPFHNDTHQDHRTTSFLAQSATRNVKQVLMYEGPTSYNDFKASFWVDISTTIEKKKEALSAHESQGAKEALKVRALEGLNAYRGYQSHVDYAEGFYTFRFIENIG